MTHSKQITMLCVLALLPASLPTTRLYGQQVVVQQPVVGTNSVTTSVSVPDRGSVLLGGVNSAESSRSNSGPLRSGPSVGTSRTSTSISASVYIHDLRAMDEAILNSTQSSKNVPTATTRQRSAPHPATTGKTESGAERAIRFERLAQNAERNGNHGVAKLHWQMAAKYGSREAKRVLSDN